jgi:hypothetical protein
VFECIERDDPDREEVERFIAHVYRRHFGARIAQWAPTLVAQRIDGQLVAAAGYRSAREALYLEHYLDAPVEQLIAAHAGTRVDRRDVVEVGHFASTRSGEGRRLLLHLARHLAHAGFLWVVSTTTQELRTLLGHLGLDALALAPADPRRLGAEALDWQRYYDHTPVVVAGHLPRSLPTLDRHGRVA